MKIVYVAAGAAGMYCGSCLHDNTLAAALGKLGEEILLVPTYTPLRTDEPDVSLPRIFYGGINVYLETLVPFYRRLPSWLARGLDAPWLLGLLSKFDFAVQAEKLGPMTLSVLRGEDGQQQQELELLVRWLRDEVRPDVVHLSNALFLGMARRITREVGVPVVCGLSGEDIFFEKLPRRYYDAVRQELRERAGDAAHYVALNDYYADFMADYLGADRRRITAIPHGLNLAGHTARTPADDGSIRIGYLARICHDKGLHVLVEAFERLCADRALPPLRLKIAGYTNRADRPYLQAQLHRLDATRLTAQVEYVGEVSRDEKLRFLQGLDLFTTPTIYRESKGLPTLEALANAVPVVQPDHGSFREIVTDTGGGLLCAPNDPADLAAKLRELILDREQATSLGQRGQQAIQARYTAAHMAERHRALYEQLTAPASSNITSSTFPATSGQQPAANSP